MGPHRPIPLTRHSDDGNEARHRFVLNIVTVIENVLHGECPRISNGCHQPWPAAVEPAIPVKQGPASVED